MSSFKRNTFEQIAFIISGALLVILPIIKWVNYGFLRGVFLLIAILVVSNILQFISGIIISNMQKSNYNKMIQIHGESLLEDIAIRAKYNGLYEGEDKIFTDVVAPSSAQNFAYIFRVLDILIPFVLYNLL